MNYFYARVSNENLSFDNQLVLLKKYAKSHNLRIDKIIKDISDGFENQKGNCLFDLLSIMNKKDMLYCYNVSRISRRASKLRTFYEMIVLKKINVIFLQNSNAEIIIKEAPIDLSVILSNISEIDAEYISIVTKNALNDLKEKGIKLGRPPKYNEEIIKKVNDMFKLGKTRLEIAQELEINDTTVWRMLNAHDTTIDNENTYANVPLETRLEIWGDKKIGKTNKELAELYNLKIETIECILKSLKGGAHW